MLTVWIIFHKNQFFLTNFIKESTNASPRKYLSSMIKRMLPQQSFFTVISNVSEMFASIFSTTNYNLDFKTANIHFFVFINVKQDIRTLDKKCRFVRILTINTKSFWFVTQFLCFTFKRYSFICLMQKEVFFSYHSWMNWFLFVAFYDLKQFSINHFFYLFFVFVTYFLSFVPFLSQYHLPSYLPFKHSVCIYAHRRHSAVTCMTSICVLFIYIHTHGIYIHVLT